MQSRTIQPQAGRGVIGLSHLTSWATPSHLLLAICASHQDASVRSPDTSANYRRYPLRAIKAEDQCLRRQANLPLVLLYYSLDFRSDGTSSSILCSSVPRQDSRDICYLIKLFEIGLNLSVSRFLISGTIHSILKISSCCSSILQFCPAQSR